MGSEPWQGAAGGVPSSSPSPRSAVPCLVSTVILVIFNDYPASFPAGYRPWGPLSDDLHLGLSFHPLYWDFTGDTGLKMGDFE